MKKNFDVILNLQVINNKTRLCIFYLPCPGEGNAHIKGDGIGTPKAGGEATIGAAGDFERDADDAADADGASVVDSLVI